MLGENTSLSHSPEGASLLIVGVDLVSLASSARREGYNVHSVGYFGDVDLKILSCECLSLVTQTQGQSCGRFDSKFKPKKFIELIDKLLKRVDVDGALLSSGLEDHPGVLESISDRVPILGNTPRIINNVRKKDVFFKTLERIGVPYPETVFAEDLDEARKKAKNIGYPVIVKPDRGYGGIGLRKAINAKTLEAIFKTVNRRCRRLLIQEFVNGKAASASLISSKGKAVTLTINEQLLGMRSLGQREPFGYCGNIVPLSADQPIIDRCECVAERVVTDFRLIGSIGVDFVITNDGTPKVVEVNPRFQGTLECVEHVRGINMVKTHIDACTLGILPKIEKYRCYCSRVILFARERSRIPDLTAFKNVRDIPLPGIIIERDEPVCSIITMGQTRQSSYTTAMENAESIYIELRKHR